MFKETDKDTQYDMFGSASSMLVGESLKEYNDKKGWHNQFRVQVTNRIDESIFKVLFNDSMGAPNASVSALIGMMILKEAFGWSDAVMYDNCRFNLLHVFNLFLFRHKNLPKSSFIEATRLHSFRCPSPNSVPT